MCTRGLLFQKFEVFGDRYEQAKKDWWKKYDDYLAITKSEQLHQESEQKDETSTLETEQSSHQQSPQ